MQLRSAARARAAFSVWVFSHVPQVGVDLCVGFFAADLLEKLVMSE